MTSLIYSFIKSPEKVRICLHEYITVNVRAVEVGAAKFFLRPKLLVLRFFNQAWQMSTNHL